MTYTSSSARCRDAHRDDGDQGVLAQRPDFVSGPQRGTRHGEVPVRGGPGDAHLHELTDQEGWPARSVLRFRGIAFRGDCLAAREGVGHAHHHVDRARLLVQGGLGPVHVSRPRVHAVPVLRHHRGLDACVAITRVQRPEVRDEGRVGVRQGNHHLHGVVGVQPSHALAGGDELSDVHHLGPHDAAEGRAHFRPRERQFRVGQGRAVPRKRSPGGGELRFPERERARFARRGGIVCPPPQEPLVLGAGDAGLLLGLQEPDQLRGDVRARLLHAVEVVRVVDAEEDLARIHAPAAQEGGCDRRDLAVDLGGDIDLGARTHRARAVDRDGSVPAGGGSGRDERRLRARLAQRGIGTQGDHDGREDDGAPEDA